ncbi:chromosomal replication initiator protein DnaA [Oleidesulfovibrio sp.]|uniref:chromosomal replication initiator protein DnaA n=1 Tax=Oleidesulfovibrio sp. TaxID=2909707 RepID=UPI003A8877A1
MINAWAQIQNTLRDNLNPGLYKVWIKPLAVEQAGDSLRLVAPNAFVASWVRDRLMNEIEKAAVSVLGSAPSISVVSAEEPKTAPKPVQVPVERRTPVAKASGSEQMGLPFAYAARPAESINWQHSFDDFVVGPSNHMAFAASQDICQQSFRSDTLFLSSDPGLGKTHLLHAVGQQLCGISNRTQPRVEYLTAEEFATRLICALKAKEVDRFKARYRDVDVLLLEDVHFLQGKQRMQDEVLSTVKALQSRGAKVLFSSSFAPRDLNDLDSQLASRFCSGLLAVIEKPTFETRKQIFREKARMHHVQLPEEVADMLANNIRADVRQIESCLRNLLLKARLLNQQITMDMAWEIIGHYASREAVLDLDSIIRQICHGFDISNEQLKSKSRRRELVIARNTAFFLARKHTDLSLEEIGKSFNRKHSTVIKGIANIEREMSKETPLGRQVINTVNLVERNGRIITP